MLSPAGVSLRSLMCNHGAGLIEKALVLTTFLDTRNIIPAAKDKMRQIFEDMSSYTKMLRPNDVDEQIDITWQAKLRSIQWRSIQWCRPNCGVSSGAGQDAQYPVVQAKLRSIQHHHHISSGGVSSGAGQGHASGQVVTEQRAYIRECMGPRRQ